MFLIIVVLYKYVVNLFLSKDWGMKIGSLKQEVPYKRVPYKRAILCIILKCVSMPTFPETIFS